MIYVQLLSEPDYRMLRRKEPKYREYCEHQFYDLLREKGDFDDPESTALLRHLHGERAVTEKWYRRTTAEGAPCLPAISREAMYGLVVIENSRQGCHTPIVEAFTGFEVACRMERSGDGSADIPLVWQALAQLDMDILLTFRKKDFSFAWEIPVDVDFVLENYPLNGQPTQVHVVNESLLAPEQRNGTWYVPNFFYDQKYRWDSDTPKVLKFLEETCSDQPPLAKGVYSIEDFQAMCQPGEDDDQSDWDCEDQIRPEQKPWRVINHMEYLPASGESRRLLYLIIEEHRDGRFCLRDNISVKYPSYDEMFCEAMDEAIPDGEVFVLPVDVNECMGCAEDLRKAVCAFRVADGVVETFGPEMGLREFEKTLRRAVESGTCQLSEYET